MIKQNIEVKQDTTTGDGDTQMEDVYQRTDDRGGASSTSMSSEHLCSTDDIRDQPAFEVKQELGEGAISAWRPSQERPSQDHEPREGGFSHIEDPIHHVEDPTHHLEDPTHHSEDPTQQGIPHHQENPFKQEDPTHHPEANGVSEAATRLSHAVVEALRVVEPTVDSVSSCGISFQHQFGSDPNLVALCLKSITDFYLTVDPATRLNTFYVLNDLIQRDPRFRLGVLTHVLPRIYWVVSCLSDKGAYLKTVTVWDSRHVYPPEVCTTITELFQSADVASKNAEEFESRLGSFTEMARIRAAKDVDLESLLRVGGGEEGAASTAVNAGTAAAIMAASQAELRSIGTTARAAVVVTQKTIEYLSRLLVDFDDGLRMSNSKSMESLVKILEQEGAR